MLDIGGRQQLRPNYLGGRSYPQQDEPLSSELESPQGSNRSDAAPLSDSLSQSRCRAQSGNSKAISLFSTEELLEQQPSSPAEWSTVCQRLTMTTDSRADTITDSSANSTADIAVAAVSKLVQNQNALPPNPLPSGRPSDPSFSFPSLSKHSSLRSPVFLSASQFCSSTHQTQKPPNTRFSMSPQTFPLQQQQYHFITNAASLASNHCRSIDREASSQRNLNDGKRSNSVESVGDSGQSSQCNVAFITNRLEKQELFDDAVATLQANYPDDVHSLKNVQVSPTKCRLYPSATLKKTSSLTNAGSSSCSFSLGEGSDLQSTVKSLLGLRLGEKAEPCVAVSSHHFSSSNNNDTQCSVYSGLIPLKSVTLSTSSPYSNVQTENTSEKLSDPAILSSIRMVTCCHNADTFTDMSPGTPPDPPKKKHCRSLSIPSCSSGNGNSRARRSAGALSSDSFRTRDSSHCCISLLKPIAFTPMNETSNPPRVQQQQTVPFSCYSGQGPSHDVQKTSSFSLSTSPLSPNTSMSASLTSLLQPTSFRGLFSSTQISGPVPINRNGSLPSAALVKTPTSTSTSPSQLRVAVTKLTSSPPPLTSDKPSSLTQSSHCCQSPPDSPVPRPASVSVLGCRYEDDADRAFKPVLDPWQCRSVREHNNSGYSSPSSCSSSSSFLLVPPHSDSRSNTEIQSATIGGLLAAPVPQNQIQRSSPTCISTSLCSPATVIGGHTQAPYWPFQKHRSFSLEEQLSQMGKPRSGSPSLFFSPSPPSSCSSVLSSPSHYHQHPYQLAAPVFQTQQYQPAYSNHTHQHHHHQFQRQQQQQQQPPPPPAQPQTVSRAGGSTPSVPVACKSSISNPSSPRRQRIPRCRSQPCVLHDRREGRKRRRDYDRPTLDFHKMTQELWTGLQQQQQPMIDNTGLWSASSLTTSTLNTLRISTMQPSCAISLEVLRKTDFLASEHGDDPLSEDAEISAATEAGEAAARAAASAATTATTITNVASSSSTIITAAVDSTLPAAITTTAVAMDDDDDDDDDVDGNWECTDLREPVLFGRSVNPIGRDMSVYVSDESNPSFCGCDDDEDDDDDDDMGSNERVDGVHFQTTNHCMFPITDLDLNQIENH